MQLFDLNLKFKLFKDTKKSGKISIKSNNRHKNIEQESAEIWHLLFSETKRNEHLSGCMISKRQRFLWREIRSE
jgi:hypothetical protein